MISLFQRAIADGWIHQPPANNADAFTFVRIRYDSTGGYGESWYHYEGRDWERWETDYPRAEKNFLIRLQELTSLEVNRQPTVLRLTHAAIYDYPFIFMSDVGWMLLTDRERSSLKRYLTSIRHNLIFKWDLRLVGFPFTSFDCCCNHVDIQGTSEKAQTSLTEK